MDNYSLEHVLVLLTDKYTVIWGFNNWALLFAFANSVALVPSKIGQPALVTWRDMDLKHSTKVHYIKKKYLIVRDFRNFKRLPV